MIAALFAALAVAGAPSETPVEVSTPTGALHGTMLKASAAGAPVALIIPGSGPTDRNGDSPLGVKASSYRLLAEALAERGVSSIRIDKRASFASKGAPMPPEGPTYGLYADDVSAWAAEGRRRTGAACVWLVGHSEGVLVSLISARKSRDLCGLVLVAGMGRPITTVIRGQLKANPANAPILDQALAALDEIEAGRRIDAGKLHPALLALFSPPAQTLLIDGAPRDPVAYVRETALPVLVVQGTTDLQVGMADAEALAGARPGVELVRLEGVNHVLKAAPADPSANFAAYGDPTLPLAPGVAEAVAEFVLRKR